MSLDQLVKIQGANGEIKEVPLRYLLYMRGEDISELLKILGIENELIDDSYEAILRRMLLRIPDDIDKRQGSIIYDALAPCAFEMAQMQNYIQGATALSYASMSSGEWLDLRVSEHGLNRKPATRSKRRAHFYKDTQRSIPYDNAKIGERFSVGDLNFSIIEKQGNGNYILQCEIEGTIDKEIQVGAQILPIEYTAGLGVAVMGEVSVAGEDKESDEKFYGRFVKSVTRPSFGGNRSDYEDYFLKVAGLGAVRLYRATPQSGQVTAIVLGSDYLPVDEQRIAEIQQTLDPADGEGLGMAPIAHKVHILSAEGVNVNISVEISLLAGAEIDIVKEDIRAKSNEYFLGLRKKFGERQSIASAEYIPIVVRNAQISAAIMECAGIMDIRGLKINSSTENIEMGNGQIPVMGEAEVSEYV